MNIFFSLFLIIYQAFMKQACVPDPTDQQAIGIWDYYVKNHYPAKGSYSDKQNLTDRVPEKEKIEYGKWIVQFLKERNKNKLQIVETNSSFPEPFKPYFWPPESEGQLGQDPPPWAYVKGNPKPGMCTEPFAYGECPQPEPYNYTLNDTTTTTTRRPYIIRYGYNSYTDKCETFIYSGCGGTANRFMTKNDCEKSCRGLDSCCAFYIDVD